MFLCCFALQDTEDKRFENLTKLQAVAVFEENSYLLDLVEERSKVQGSLRYYKTSSQTSSTKIDKKSRGLGKISSVKTALERLEDQGEIRILEGSVLQVVR